MLSCFSGVWLSVTPWTVACQAFLSMGFSREEYWSGLPCSHPWYLSDPGIKPTSLMSPALADGFFTTSTTCRASYIGGQLSLFVVQSVTKLCSTQRPQELQSARLPCPSLYPGACSDSCPLNWWCHPTISSSVTPVSFCPQSLPASGAFALYICPNPWNVQLHEWTLGLPW